MRRLFAVASILGILVSAACAPTAKQGGLTSLVTAQGSATPTISVVKQSEKPTPGPTPHLSSTAIVQTQAASVRQSPKTAMKPVAAAFVDGKHGWAVVGDCDGSSENCCSVIATADGGKTWTEEYHTKLALRDIHLSMPAMDGRLGTLEALSSHRRHYVRA